MHGSMSTYHISYRSSLQRKGVDKDRDNVRHSEVKYGPQSQP